MEKFNSELRNQKTFGFMLLFGFILCLIVCGILTLTSCGGGKSEKEAITVEETIPEKENITVEEVETTSNSNDYSSSSNSDASVSNSNSNEDWDAVLKSYEKFIDDYIRLMKKAMSGDLSALSEYAGLLEKAEELGNKLDGAKSDLTPSQAAKFVKLQEKLVNAAANL